MRCFFTRILLGAALSLFSVTAQAAVILNGDFSIPGVSPDPFAHWETDLFFGSRPADGGGFVQFNVVDVFDDQQLQQQFTLPSTATTLSFEVQLSTSAGGSSGLIPDSFQAALFDSAFNPLFPSGDPALFPAFFSVDNDGTEFFDGAFVSAQNIGGVRRVSLDVSSLSSQDLLLEFLALGSNDGLETTVDVDNVELAMQSQPNVIPEPASLFIWSAGIAIVGIFFGGRRRQALAVR